MNKFEKTASLVLEKVGGKDNIAFVTHCMTRVRISLKDESLVSVTEIESIEGVLGCQFSGGQFQVIIGPGVEKVYEAFCKQGDFAVHESIKENLDGKNEPFSIKKIGVKVLDSVAGCITPILPILIVSGLIRMIAALISPSLLNIVSETSDIYRLLTLVSDAGFYFFPVFIAVSGAKKFGCNPMLAVLMGAVMLHPTMMEIIAETGSFAVFGIPMIKLSYASSVVPMILITWIMSYVEKFFKKWVPDAVSTMFVPLFTILVMLPLGLCILSPLGAILGLGLNQIFIVIRTVFGPLGVAIIGAFWLVLVLTGMHPAIIATAIMTIMSQGYEDTVLVGAAISIYASLAISLAIMIKAKNAEDRSLAVSCFVAQALGGVGEPTIFGIGMRFRKTIVYATIGVFLGTLYAAFMNVGVYFLASSNFMQLLAFSSPDPKNILHGSIGCAITFIVTFVLMMVFGYENKEAKV